MDLDFLKVMYRAGALLGLHLVEPNLSLTTSAERTYSKIIPAFQQLYQELEEVDVATLLQVQEPAFRFVSQERFHRTKYDEDVCDAILKVATSFQPQVIKLLQMILLKLATGFQRQQGDIFAFGDYDESA